MIFSFEGNQREGKNVGAVLLAPYFQKLTKNSPIWANFHLYGIPNFHYFEDWNKIPKKGNIIDLENCIIIYDEIGTSADSRLYKSKSQVIFTHSFAQFGKKGITFIYTAQRPYLVEKRVREQTDIVIKVKKDLMTKTFYQQWWDTRQGREQAKLIGNYLLAKPEEAFNKFNTLEVISSTANFDDQIN